MIKPILFNTEMVQAIPDGRKKVTRRLIKPQPDNKHQSPLGYCVSSTGSNKDNGKYGFGIDEYGGHIQFANPQYHIGDILYVTETWRVFNKYENAFGFDVLYKSDEKIIPCSFKDRDRYLDKFMKYESKNGWQSPYFMPKEAARIFLKVTSVKIERLQDITEEQAVKEGIVRLFDHMTSETYGRWAHGITDLNQNEQPWNNYLWHGHFGNCGCGNKLSDAWQYQRSGYENPIDSFSSLWNTTVPIKDWIELGWHANPWVWAIEFEPCEKPEGWPE